MTEIEQCRNAIKEYRKGYGQHQLKDDCIIQLMIGHHKERVNAISKERSFSEKEVLKLLLDSEEFTSRFNSRTDLTKWFKEQLLKQ